MTTSHRFLTGAAVTAAALLASAVPASAGTLVYTKADGNVYATSPDGARTKQITTDAATLGEYRTPDLQDDGTVVTAHPQGSLRTFHRFNLDGTSRGAPAIGPGNSCGTGPLDFDAPPTGNLMIVHYIHSDYCFNPTPGNGPRDRVTPAFDDIPTGPSIYPKHDNWNNPRWVPGTGVAAMVSSSGNSIGIQSGSSVSGIVSPDPGEQIESFDISRTGNRMLVETRPTGAGNGVVSQLELFQFDGVPSTTTGGSTVCEVNGFANANGEADPRWSPDGSQVTWEGAGGVYVSPAPTAGVGCRLQPTLVVPGGKDPAWGSPDLPAAPPPDNGGNGGNDNGGNDNGGNDNGGNDQGGNDNGNDDGGNGSDKSAPQLTLGGAGSAKLAKALAKGYGASVTVSEQSKLTGDLLLDGRTAKKLGLPKRVATGSLTAPAGKSKLVVAFTSKARKKLKGRRSVKLSLKVIARDGAGNVSPAATRGVTLKR